MNIILVVNLTSFKVSDNILKVCQYIVYQLNISVLDSDDSEIVRTCGRSIPGTILSSGNMLTIVFKTDDSRAGRGFLANWTKINIDGDIISSPNYPLQYGNNEDIVSVLII